MKKQVLSFFFIIALLLCLVPWTRADGDGSSPEPNAAQTDPTGSGSDFAGIDDLEDKLPRVGEIYSLTVGDDLLPQTNEALLDVYVTEMFRSGDPDDLTFSQYKRLDPSQVLNNLELAMEGGLKTVIQAIARGDRSSSEIELRLSDLELDYYLASHMDMEKVLHTLILDCTYELYWFGRYIQWTFPSEEKIVFYFYVSDDCAMDSAHLRVKSEAVRAAKEAVKKTDAIISSNAGLSDVEKLRAYKNEICRLTEYNTDAAYTDAFAGQEGPWNLVWVFDGDPTTNVVCEGYAKAFEYLCNRSTFRSKKVNCICSTGTAVFSNGSTGPHMWNIVTLEDDRNYVIDVTNCDTGTTGNETFFLCCGLEGTAQEGYVLSNGSFFGYDSTTLAATNTRTRTLATSPFQGAPGDVSFSAHPAAQRIAEGQDVTFMVTASGTSLSYQWYCLTSPAKGWQQVAGATEPTLTLTTEATMDRNIYFCLVSGASGRRASESALLEVAVKPVIVEQTSDITVIQSEETILTVKVTGNYLTYQWYSRDYGSDEWREENYNGYVDEFGTGQGPSFRINTHPDKDLSQYYCRITNGPWIVTSDIITVSIIAEPRRDTASYMKDAEVEAGATATFQIFMEPNRYLEYQWYRFENGQSIPIAGATTDTYSFVATAEMDGDWYQCVVSNAAGTYDEMAQLWIITDPPAITEQPQDASCPSYDRVPLHVAATGRGLSYQWYCFDGEREYALTEDGANNPDHSILVTDDVDGNQYWCVVSNALGTEISRRMTVRVLNLPVIEEGPQDVCLPHEATSVTFTVVAKGEELQYQWIEFSLGSCNIFEDCNSPSITIPVTLDKDGCWYRCDVTNPAGTVQSREAILTFQHVPGDPVHENEVPATTTSEGSYDEVVYCTICHKQLSWEHHTTPRLPAEAPTITQQPKDAKVKSGSKAKFTVKVKDKNVSYQWYSKAPKGDWTLMKGETKNTLTVTASGANNGYQYRCLVKNKAGGEAYTKAVTLTVTLQPPVIKTQPKDVAAKSGAKAKFSVKASGKNISYQWYERENADAEWKLMKGETKNTLQVVASKATDGHQYYCHLKNTDGEADSKAAKLTVKTEAPTIKTQPKNLSVKSGKKAKFSVKASGKNLKYQWYERSGADAEWVAVSGGTKNSLSVETSKAKNGYQYYCKVTNPDGTVDSAVATLTVTPEAPVIKTQPKDAKVKAGGKAKFKVKASPKNVTYQWYYRENENAEWKLINGATKAEYSFVASAEMFGWQFRCLAKNPDGEAWSKIATLLQKQK